MGLGRKTGYLAICEAVKIVRECGKYKYVQMDEMYNVNEWCGMMLVESSFGPNGSWLSEDSYTTTTFPAEFIDCDPLNKRGLREWADGFHKERLAEEMQKRSKDSETTIAKWTKAEMSECADHISKQSKTIMTAIHSNNYRLAEAMLESIQENAKYLEAGVAPFVEPLKAGGDK